MLNLGCFAINAELLSETGMTQMTHGLDMQNPIHNACPHIEKIKGQEFLDYISRCPSKESDEVDSTSEPKELRVVPQPIQEDPMVHQTTSKIKALVSTEEVQKVNYEQDNDIFKQIFCDDRVCKSAIIEKKYKFGRTTV